MKEQYAFSGVKNKKALQTIEMSIAADGAQYLMYNLTNLYTKPLLAIIREYTANAYDSHMRSGTKEPVRLSFKSFYVNLGDAEKIGFSGEALQITIQDFGLGMSLKDITDTYSKYGKSTKRDNNKEVGTYGLGSKSGLSLAHYVDVYAVKDGIATHAIIRLNNIKFPVIDIMDTSNVSGVANGVTITMVVPKPDAMVYQEIEKLFAAWKPGQIIVDGKIPYSIYNDTSFTPIDGFGKNIKGWIRQERNYDFQFFASGIFVGPIFYQIDISDLKKYFSFTKEILSVASKIVINVPLSSVDLTPPREGLAYTERTIKNLRSAYDALFEDILNYYSDHMNSLSATEAFKFAAKNFSNIVALTAYVNNKRIDDTIPILWNGDNMNTVYNISDSYYDSLHVLQHNKNEITIKPQIYVLKEKSKYNPQANFIRLDLDTDQNTWVTSNIKDYALAMETTVENMYALIIPHYFSKNSLAEYSEASVPNDEFWFNVGFPPVKKNDFLEVARQYRKINKKTAVKSSITYPVVNRDQLHVEMLSVTDIPKQSILIDDKDKIVSNFAFSQMIKNFGPNALPYANKKVPTALMSLLDVMDMLEVSSRNIVYIKGRSLTHALTKIPDSTTLAEVIYGRYKKYSDEEQIYIRMITQLIALNKMDDLLKIEFICREIIKNDIVDKIKDSFVHGFVVFMSDDIDSSQWKLKRVIASHLNGRRRTDELLQQKMTNINYSTLNLFPFLATGIFHEKQTIDYLNTISLEQINFSGDFMLYNTTITLADFSKNLISSLAHSRTWDYQ